MTTVVAEHEALQARATPTVMDRLGWSAVVLYWCAGLLLIIPIALGFWALGSLWKTIRAPRGAEPRSRLALRGR